MYIDSSKLQQGQNISAEICIVGGGAAGITIAKKLAESNIGVCLVESGGIEFDRDTQNLYAGENIGEAYESLDLCRLRFFGGSTNHWGGWTRPLDPIDFKPRDYLSSPGWPINEETLNPYREEADRILQLGEHRFDAEYWREQKRHIPPFDNGVLKSSIYRLSPPTRFASAYGHELNVAQNIWCCLGANVIDISFNESGNTAQRVIARTLNDITFTISAYIVIIAAGGIENARLMLACNGVHEQGIGNQHDLVGRYFADHRGLWGGFMIPSNPKEDLHAYSLHQPFLRTGQSPHAIITALTLGEDEIVRRELPNFSAFIAPANFPAAPESEKIRASRLTNAVSLLAARHKISSRYGDADMPPVPTAGNIHQVIINAEPFPMRQSRITLSNEKDHMGMRRSRLFWQNSPSEKDKLTEIMLALAEKMGAANLGRIYLPQDYQWPPTWQELGRHHMGTTRMSESAKTGVVDSDCRVHGINNLYIAGSSVFPTYGYAQPTHTIVTLALRLAVHLVATRPQWRNSQ